MERLAQRYAVNLAQSWDSNPDPGALWALTSSISHCTTDSTAECFTTSRRTPPSPPPMISTCEGRESQGQGRSVAWARTGQTHRTVCSEGLGLSSDPDLGTSFSTLRHTSLPREPSLRGLPDSWKRLPTFPASAVTVCSPEAVSPLPCEMGRSPTYSPCPCWHFL